MRWLRFRFHAPLAAFGGESIDAKGVIRHFPAQSMMTGLFANALGWKRAMRAEHQALQDRIIWGVIMPADSYNIRMTDYQTAKLNKDDKAWTTRGEPAGRAGGAGTYTGAHQRWRDYYTDMQVDGVVRLEPVDDIPTLDDLASALKYPARPLFIGRKSCLPAKPIYNGCIEAPDARDALEHIACETNENKQYRIFWPATEGGQGAARIMSVTDERNWETGLHGGSRLVCEGSLPNRESKA